MASSLEQKCSKGSRPPSRQRESSRCALLQAIAFILTVASCCIEGTRIRACYCEVEHGRDSVLVAGTSATRTAFLLSSPLHGYRSVASFSAAPQLLVSRFSFGRCCIPRMATQNEQEYRVHPFMMPPDADTNVVRRLATNREELFTTWEKDSNAGHDSSSGPEKLIVLAHGLAGTSEDQCNEDKTRDGVEAGGLRLAKEILQCIQKHSSLKRICLVGNSLGGLYSRYAAALLYSGGPDGTFAGLRGDCFLTTATPHLGTRNFTFVPIPQPLHGLASVFVGRTGEDLFMQQKSTDEPPLLEQMATHPIFLDALCAFRRRRAYANLEGDFLVPFGTAAFEVDAQGNGWGITERGVAESFIKRSIKLDTTCRNVECELTIPKGASPANMWSSMPSEARMAASLNACGWSKVGIHFPGPIPLSHNKICALEGGGLLRAPVKWIWKEGRGVVDHVAAYLLQDHLSQAESNL